MISFIKKNEHILNVKYFGCKRNHASFSTSTKLFLYLLSLYLVIVILGSSISVFEFFIKKESSSNSSLSLTVISTHLESNLINLDNIKKEQNMEFISTNRCFYFYPFNQIIKFFRCYVASMKKFIKCFCLFCNSSKILDIKESQNDFRCIHGLRVISMAWIILGHTYVHNTDIIGNYVDLLHGIDNMPFQVILQGTFSVDTFFVMSGFLLTALFLQESVKRQGKINWFALCLHRFLRISPLYLILIAFNTLLFKYTGSGPFWGDNSDAESCRHYWWWNILFINNFLPLNSTCMSWTWYLANDMQFFILGSLVLYVFQKRQAVVVVVLCMVLICSWIVTWLISYFHNVIPLFSGITSASDYKTYKEQLYSSWKYVYTKPYCRIGPYIIGMLLAFVLYKCKRNSIDKSIQFIFWSCSTIFSLSVIYGLFYVSNSPMLLHFYNTFSRSLFSLGVAWVIYSCLTNNADMVNRILSCSVFVPLSRLTYTAYLFHPLIMSWYYDSLQVPLHFTHTSMVMLYFGFLVTSYAIAFIISITFESPLVNVEKILTKRFS